MRSVSADKRAAWSISTDGPIQGIQIDLLKQTVIFPWSQFLYAEGDDTQIRIIFAMHEVTVVGSGLSLLLVDVREQCVVRLREPGRTGEFIAEPGPRITRIWLRKLE
jgi:hypothetical protein